jgi:uncharacterized protein YegJ (DUF2314 family)
MRQFRLAHRRGDIVLTTNAGAGNGFRNMNSNRHGIVRVFLLVLAALSFVVFSGCSKNQEGGNYTSVSKDDRAMNDAIAKAKATSGEFIKAFHEQKGDASDFYVKKPYPTPTGGQEHMWIEVSSETNGLLTGRVANDAEDTREVKMGQQVNLKIEEISDWRYQVGKKLMGGYTIRYFVEKMSPKEREEFLKENNLEL